MNKLTSLDFEFIKDRYFSHILDDGYEISLEPCFNGFDVGIYTPQKELVGEKVCTNLRPFSVFDLTAGSFAYSIALQVANKLYKDHLL